MSTQLVKFEYNAKGIRGDDERKMLCLTDMWRADGADPSRKPAEWLRGDGARYVKFLEENLKVGTDHFECIRTLRGGNDASTWAMPKVALAYGMYLSTAFQDHCLEIILKVYSEGGYVVPGRESEFTQRLLAQLERMDLALSRAEGTNAQLLDRIRLLDSPNGLVHPAQAEMIRKAIKAIAADENADGALSPLVAYRLIDNRVRGRIRPPFTVDAGGKWDNLPQGRFGEVMSELARMAAEAEAKARSVARYAAKKAAAKQAIIQFKGRH